MKQEKWKEFEALVAKIQAELAPHAVVKHDDKIEGRSGKLRQVDVSVRAKVGQFDFLMALECKDHASPVDVGEVDAFIGLLQDIAAHRGALVSAVGFTALAKARAKQAGIDLYRPVDTGDHTWKVSPLLPVVFDVRSISYSFAIGSDLPLPFRLPSNDVGSQIVYDRDKQPLGTAFELFERAINERRIPLEPGEHLEVDFVGQVPHMNNGYRQIIPVSLQVEVEVRQSLKVGNVGLEQISGFKDELTGFVWARQLRSEKLDLEKIEKEWRSISTTDELELHPLVTVRVVEYVG